MPENPPRIVIAETDDDIALLLKGVFKLNGFATWRVSKAEECIALLHEVGGRVEVVVICGQLASDRGVMLIVNIKKINPKIKILVIAERNEEESKTRVLDYGADEFVLKPLSLESLVNKANALLIEKAVAAAASSPATATTK